MASLKDLAASSREALDAMRLVSAEAAQIQRLDDGDIDFGPTPAAGSIVGRSDGGTTGGSFSPIESAEVEELRFLVLGLRSELRERLRDRVNEGELLARQRLELG